MYVKGVDKAASQPPRTISLALAEVKMTLYIEVLTIRKYLKEGNIVLNAPLKLKKGLGLASASSV